MDNFLMFIQVFGGLGLFLYGMDMLSEGLKSIAGDKLKNILNKVTSNPIKAAILGTIVTMIIQSSSATTVLVVGLVNAELMNIIQAAGVILGANIGTTITAQIIAFDLSAYAPLFIAVGAFMKILSNNEKIENLGSGILGFGILFFGINTMSETLVPLVDKPIFSNILLSLGAYPILGLIAGIIVTAIVQSSSATIGMLQALAIGGAFADLSNFQALSIIIPIVLGMNIGTCVTAIFAMIGSSRSAKQTASLHLIFKLLGAALMMIVILITGGFTNNEQSIVYKFVISISGSNTSRQIANFHTFFNIANTLIFLPFIKPITDMVQKIIPEKKQEEEQEFKLKFNDILLENPSVAISEIIGEAGTMAEIAFKSYNTAFECVYNNDISKVEDVKILENLINKFETGISEFLIKISALNLSLREADLVIHLFNAIHHIEKIGDHSMNLADMALRIKERDIKFSENAKHELDSMHLLVKESLRTSIDSFETSNLDKAYKVHILEKQIIEKEEDLRMAHIERLNQKRCTPETGVLYLDVVTDFARIGNYSEGLSKFVKANIDILPAKHFDVLQ